MVRGEIRMFRKGGRERGEGGRGEIERREGGMRNENERQK